MQVNRDRTKYAQCNFCSKKSMIFTVSGDGFLIVSICESCINELGNKSKSIISTICPVCSMNKVKKEFNNSACCTKCYNEL